MKLIVREHITAVAEPIKKVFNVTIDAVNNFGKIPMSIGIKKGDLIIFRGEGDPIRVPAGTVAGRILVTDPDSECGWSIVPNSSSSGSSVKLHNTTGVLVKGGTVVKISGDFDFVKATAADTAMLFVTAEDCAADTDVVCYGVANTICSVLCTTDAVAVNDQLHVSSTDGLAEAVSENGFAIALSAKAAGSVGVVDAIIVQNGFLPLNGGTISGNLEVTGDIKADSDIKAAGDADVTGGISAGGNVITAANFRSKNTNCDNTAASIPANQYNTWGYFDKNDAYYAFLEGIQRTTGTTELRIGSRRNIGGSNVDNSIELSVKNDGSKTVSVSDASAWLSALGLVPEHITLSGTNTKCSKFGCVVTVDLFDQMIANWQSSATIGTLPVGWRPKNTIRSYGKTINGIPDFEIQIRPNGVIEFVTMTGEGYPPGTPIYHYMTFVTA